MKKNYLALFFIILTGSWLRLMGVFSNSFAFTYDVGRDMLALFDISHFVHLPFIGATTGLPGIYYGPWWYYMLTPFFFVSGGNPQFIAFVMALVGIATVFLAYLFGKKIGGEFLGFSFAALTSVSPIMISLSSQIWNPNIAPFFGLLTLIVLEKIYSDKKTGLINFFSLGMLLTLAIDIEIVWGLLFSFSIILSAFLIRMFRFSLKEIVVFFAGCALILFPRILFEVKNYFLMTKSLFLFFGTGTPRQASFIQAIPDRTNIFLNQFVDTLASNNKALAVIEIIFILICISLLYKRVNQNIKDFIKTAGIIIGIFFLGTAFFSHDIWPHYLVGLPIFYIFLFAISLDLLRLRLKNLLVPSAILLIVFLFNFNPISFIENFSKPLWEGDASVYRNQLAVVDYVYKQASGRKFKYVVYTPPVHDYTYQYLFKWYGSGHYGYLPSEGSNLAYFILEPDNQYPKRLSDWLIKREGDGRIIKSQVVKGGIIVQTRVNE